MSNQVNYWLPYALAAVGCFVILSGHAQSGRLAWAQIVTGTVFIAAAYLWGREVW